MSSEPARTIHLVPHTHWDREWYRPFQSFRMQLVEVVDRVLDMLEAQPEFAFTLDGQLATVDDYLEIRPEAEERIRGLVASGRLAIGPWQILMDEFLVSGETIVRNLEMGSRRAEAFGRPMPIGYLPDMFGHVAQMPQLLRRAGLEHAVVWRGVPSSVDRHGFRWESPDGSTVRAEYLYAGYGNAAYLFADAGALADAADRFLDSSASWFGSDPILGMVGTDHTAPHPRFAELVATLNAAQHAASVRIGTLAAYIDAMGPLDGDAPVWRGEMRSGARSNVLMGVASARIDIKQAAARAETALERYAEPLTALHLPAVAWPASFLRLAWRKVIENSAHDSICGCSVDPVVAQVLVRFAEAEQIGANLARRAAVAVARRVARGSVAVLNPSPTARSGLVEVELPVPDEWDEVSLELPDGLRLGTQELERKERLLLEDEMLGGAVEELFQRFHGREIFDHAWNGVVIGERAVTFEVDDDPDPTWLDVDRLRAEVTAAMREEPDATWRIRIEARPRRTVAASVPAPSLGWTAARPVEGRGEVASGVEVAGDGRTIANGLIVVEVEGDGTLRLTAADGTTVAGVGRIVDGGDFGDSYNYGPPASDTVVQAPASTSVSAELTGRVRGRLVVSRTYGWPAGLASDGTERTADVIATEVRTEIELRAGEPFVRIGVSFENRSDDHRVRFAIPLPRPAGASHAEGQFAVVERGLRAEGGYREEPLPTFPAHGWVDAGGMAVLARHLVEYEVTDDGRELAVTLLRATGLISRNANPSRLDPAGPEIGIPNGQMRGRWRFELALMPHAGDWADGGVAVAAESYRHALVALGGLASDGAWPPPGAGDEGVAIDGRSVVLSSLRRRDDGWLEVRLVNLGGTSQSTVVRGGLLEAREASLRGVPGNGIPVTGGALRLELGPAEIRTVQFRRTEPATAAEGMLDAGGPRQTI